ncbi:MAG: hypothetical protein K9M44_04950 [Candidatus Pacebacteria bacterium]|nr:hypothetical protein [Candidatus Paceibacterota bacterium]
MNKNNFTSLLKAKGLNILFIIATFLVIAALFSFLQPLKYKAENKILIEQNVDKIDPYNIAKINEYYSSLIKEIVLSDSFFAQVLNQNNGINKNYFDVELKKQSKLWQETVAVEFAEAGTLNLKTYHPNPAQAKEILQTINNLLINKNSNFETIDEGIKIKAINQIIISDYPAKPNILQNFIFALILGIIATLLYIYYLTEKNISTPINNRKNSIPVDIKPKLETNNFKTEDIKESNGIEDKNSRQSDNKEYHHGSYSPRQIREENQKEKSLPENESVDPYKMEDKADINNLFK